MFESLPVDDTAARIRSAAGPPLTAFLLTLAYLTIYPMFTRVPAALFWSIATILLAGTMLGGLAIVRILRRERVRGRAIGWLAGTVALELTCARIFLGLTLPWI